MGCELHFKPNRSSTARRSPAHRNQTATAPIGQALSFSGKDIAPKLTTLASSMFHWS
jgi:hypothetical protein